jgi:hypothetical protein
MARLKKTIKTEKYDATAETQTEHLPTTNLEPYFQSNLLGIHNL